MRGVGACGKPFRLNQTYVENRRSTEVPPRPNLATRDSPPATRGYPPWAVLIRPFGAANQRVGSVPLGHR
jgi:hypothetical protein